MKKTIFGKINTSFSEVYFYTDKKPQCPNGFVLMKNDRPLGDNYIVSENGEWIIDKLTSNDD